MKVSLTTVHISEDSIPENYISETAPLITVETEFLENRTPEAVPENHIPENSVLIPINSP
jgi:hypothetical protein